MSKNLQADFESAARGRLVSHNTGLGHFRHRSNHNELPDEVLVAAGLNIEDVTYRLRRKLFRILRAASLTELLAYNPGAIRKGIAKKCVYVELENEWFSLRRIHQSCCPKKGRTGDELVAGNER